MKFSLRGAPPGFTLLELLIAATVLLVTTLVLSTHFAQGLDTFRHLNSEDVDELVLADAQALVDRVEEADSEARAFIAESLRSGVVDHQQATALRLRYEGIRAAAADLLAHLQIIEPSITGRPARLAFGRVIASLSRLQTSAALTVEILVILESGGFIG
jgi:type II secretory pathway pseudopilin PulG